MVLIVLGILFLFDTIGLLDFSDFVQRFWPVILIVFGICILRRQSSSRRHERNDAPDQKVFGDIKEDVTAERINYSTIFGDLRMHVVCQSFRGGSVSTAFGDTDIDLSGAKISDGEHSLKVSGIFGDAKIVLPKNIAFSVSSSTLFGEVQYNDDRREGFSPSLLFESAGYDSAPKRLRIEASQLFGDVLVRN